MAGSAIAAGVVPRGCMAGKATPTWSLTWKQHMSWLSASSSATQASLEASCEHININFKRCRTGYRAARAARCTQRAPVFALRSVCSRCELSGYRVCWTSGPSVHRRPAGSAADGGSCFVCRLHTGACKRVKLTSWPVPPVINLTQRVRISRQPTCLRPRRARGRSAWRCSQGLLLRMRAWCLSQSWRTPWRGARSRCAWATSWRLHTSTQTRVTCSTQRRLRP